MVCQLREGNTRLLEKVSFDSELLDTLRESFNFRLCNSRGWLR